MKGSSFFGHREQAQQEAQQEADDMITNEREFSEEQEVCGNMDSAASVVVVVEERHLDCVVQGFIGRPDDGDNALVLDNTNA